MRRETAIRLLGGTQQSAADQVGITRGAVSLWPEVLPDRIADRVIAAIARRYLRPELLGIEHPQQQAEKAPG